MEEIIELPYNLDFTFVNTIDPFSFVLSIFALIVLVTLSTEAVIHIVTSILEYCQTAFNHLTINKKERKHLE